MNFFSGFLLPTTEAPLLKWTEWILWFILLNALIVATETIPTLIMMLTTTTVSVWNVAQFYSKCTIVIFWLVVHWTSQEWKKLIMIQKHHNHPKLIKELIIVGHILWNGYELLALESPTLMMMIKTKLSRNMIYTAQDLGFISKENNKGSSVKKIFKQYSDL